MDDRRFDSLVKALAKGKSRRSVLKGLFGLGGAAIAGSVLLDADSEAARRPPSIPTPRPTCPGSQTWTGSTCECIVPPAPGPSRCGPDCCNPAGIGAAHSECCENACCFGTCYGEELCCPTNNRPGELPPTHIVCDGPNGPVCLAGNCCDDGDCGDPCQVCNGQTHICEERCSGADQVCCTEQAGPGICVTGACCLGAPCGEGRVCCQGTEGTGCVEGNCCGASDCPPSTACTTNSCQNFACVAIPVDCNDGNACTIDGCDPAPVASTRRSTATTTTLARPIPAIRPLAASTRQSIAMTSMLARPIPAIP